MEHVDTPIESHVILAELDVDVMIPLVVPQRDDSLGRSGLPQVHAVHDDACHRFDPLG